MIENNEGAMVNDPSWEHLQYLDYIEECIIREKLKNIESASEENA